MSSNETEDQKLSARANELYWQSGQSVNQIAEQMDLSKSRLYGLVQPLAAGNPCPECQADLFFPNRTAMEKRFVSCNKCAFEGALDDVPAGDEKPTSGATPDTKPARSSTRNAIRTGAGSKRVLWGSALLGVAAGLYLAIRHRRS